MLNFVHRVPSHVAHRRWNLGKSLAGGIFIEPRSSFWIDAFQVGVNGLEDAEHLIERMILKHQQDDVFYRVCHRSRDGLGQEPRSLWPISLAQGSNRRAKSKRSTWPYRQLEPIVRTAQSHKGRRLQFSHGGA